MFVVVVDVGEDLRDSFVVKLMAYVVKHLAVLFMHVSVSVDKIGRQMLWVPLMFPLKSRDNTLYSTRVG